MKRKINEKIYGNLATVYHGTHSDPDKFINSLFTPGSGDYYGRGMYTVYELTFDNPENNESLNSRTPSNTAVGSYGDTLIKMYASLHNCLNWDEVLKAHKYAISNFNEFGLEDIQNLLKKQLTSVSAINKTVAWLKKNMTLVQKSLISGFTSDIAKPFIDDNPEMIGLLGGMVYTGRQDGRCMVIYDPHNYYPVAYRSIVSSQWIKFPKDQLTDFQKNLKKSFRSIRGISAGEEAGTDSKKKLLDQMFNMLQTIYVDPQRDPSKAVDLMKYFNWLEKAGIPLNEVPNLLIVIMQKEVSYPSIKYYFENYVYTGKLGVLKFRAYQVGMALTVYMVENASRISPYFDMNFLVGTDSIDSLKAVLYRGFMNKLSLCYSLFFSSKTFEHFIRVMAPVGKELDIDQNSKFMFTVYYRMENREMANKFLMVLKDVGWSMQIPPSYIAILPQWAESVPNWLESEEGKYFMELARTSIDKYHSADFESAYDGLLRDFNHIPHKLKNKTYLLLLKILIYHYRWVFEGTSMTPMSTYLVRAYLMLEAGEGSAVDEAKETIHQLLVELFEVGDYLMYATWVKIMQSGYPDMFLLVTKYGAYGDGDILKDMHISDFEGIMQTWDRMMGLNDQIKGNILKMCLYMKDFLYENKGVYPDYYTTFNQFFPDI